MQPSEKYHITRLKSIAQTLSSAQADKKSLVAMVAKMEKSTAKLKANITNLDAKINKYEMLYANVKKDPNYKLNPDQL
jgi:cell division protein FtsB